MKKKYLVLVDGLFALLGSAINFFGPILILAMGIGAYKDTFRYFIALNIWNVFIFLVAIASKYLLRDEKRIKKWILYLFLIAGSILFLASILAVCENIPFLEGLVNGLLGKMFTDSQLFAAYFYSQWVAGGLLVICGIAFLLSLKKLHFLFSLQITISNSNLLLKLVQQVLLVQSAFSLHFLFSQFLQKLTVRLIFQLFEVVDAL